MSSTAVPYGVYLKLIKSSSALDLPVPIFSHAASYSFPRKYGDAKGTPAQLIFIPAHNPSFKVPEGS